MAHPFHGVNFSALIEKSETEIDRLYHLFPSQMREQLEKLRDAMEAEPADLEMITEDDKKRILEDIDRFFKREPGEGES